MSERNRRFEEVLQAVHTRENSTLLIATFASSASLALFAAVGSSTLPIIGKLEGWGGIWFPIFGYLYRELTIFNIDRVDLRDLHQMIGAGAYGTLGRTALVVALVNLIRRLLVRVFLLFPTVMWIAQFTGSYYALQNYGWVVVSIGAVLTVGEELMKRWPEWKDQGFTRFR